MSIYYDLENYLANDTPSAISDRLRGEIGMYQTPNGFKNYKSNKLASFSISSVDAREDQLFPSKGHRITLVGGLESFRDQAQWNEHVTSLVSTNKFYFNHAFSINIMENDNKFYNIFHHPEYEDLTKAIDTNLLLNYNILNIKDKGSNIKDMAALRSTFEENVQLDFETDDYLRGLIDNYSRRLDNYINGVTQFGQKNENIFFINKDKKTTNLKNYPFALSFGSLLKENDTSFIDFLEENHMTKFIFQAIKNNLSSQLLSFNYQGTISNLKTHNLLAIFNNIDYNNFIEDSRELFLLNAYDKQGSSSRFLNQIKLIKILQRVHQMILSNLKNYNQLIDGEKCETFNLGFKIEKYIDNDVTLPIQIFYIRNTNNLLQFIDTQMKFGRKYIYKIYNLVCVFGSKYEYKNLAISNKDNELQLSAGGILQNSFDPNPDLIYRAELDVEITPSIQIIEEPIYQFEKMFFDQIPPKPIPSFHQGRDSVLITLEPLIHSRSEETFQPLHNEELLISDKLALSSATYPHENYSYLYFNGDYLIYRMDREPQSIDEFYDSFLTSVNTENILRSRDTQDKRNFLISKSKSIYTSFRDHILPNKKYYYLFRTSTYHNTPSNYSDIFEVEFSKTASDVMLKARIFSIPEQKIEREKTKHFKRLMKITPNFEQISFPPDATNVEEAINNMGILDKKLFIAGTENINYGNKFKIRITSKHTGKKIDLNVNFKIIKKTNYN